MILTKKQRQALEIVKEHGPIHPREFARFMWPDSDGWRTSTKCGPGGKTRGGGMNLAGGAYLGKLRQKGWVKDAFAYHSKSYQKGYVLTDAGHEILGASREDHQKDA